MVNINKLRGKMAENEISVERLANQIGVDKATVYRKINNNGESFSISEADRIVEALGLNASEAQSIFFSQLVS